MYKAAHAGIVDLSDLSMQDLIRDEKGTNRNSKYKMANTSATWQQAARTTYYHLLAAHQKPYEEILNEKYWRIFCKDVERS